MNETKRKNLEKLLEKWKSGEITDVLKFDIEYRKIHQTKELTERQQHVLDTYEGFYEAEGRPPSLREMSTLLDVSPTSVATSLKWIKNKGVELGDIS